MSEYAYPVGDGLCAYARDSVVAVGTIDSDCHCSMRVLTTSSVWTLIKVGSQIIKIRALGGSKFEVMDTDKTWPADSKVDHGDYCAPSSKESPTS